MLLLYMVVKETIKGSYTSVKTSVEINFIATNTLSLGQTRQFYNVLRSKFPSRGGNQKKTKFKTSLCFPDVPMYEKTVTSKLLKF